MTVAADDWVSIPSASPASATDDWVSMPAQSKPSFASDVANDVNSRTADAANAIERGHSGEINPLSAGIQGTTSLMKVTPDIMGEAIKRVPGYDTARNAVNSAGEWVGDKLLQSGAAPAFDAAANPLHDFAQAHPEYTADMQGGASILGTLYGAEQAGQAGNLASKGMKSAADYAGAGGENAARNILSNNQTGSNFPDGPRAFTEQKSVNDALGANTSAGYNKAEALGANLSPTVAQAASRTIRSDVENAVNNGTALDSQLHTKTIAALNNLDNKAQSGLTINSFENTRKQLGKISASDPGGIDGGAARQGIKAIDNWYDNMQNNPSLLTSGDPAAVSALKDARAAHALESQHDTVLEILRQANGNPNAIQSKFKSLFNDQDELNRFSPQDQQTISLLAHPDGMNKILQTVGKVGFGGSSTLPIFEAGSGVGALLTGNPAVAAAVAGTVGTGTAANAVRSRMVHGMADNLLKNIESKSVPVTPAVPTPAAPNFSPRSAPRLPAPNGPTIAMPNPTQALPAPPNFSVNKVGTATPPGGASYSQPRGAMEAPATGQGNPAENMGTDPEYQAMETLKNLERKRGGAIPTPAQIREINKKAGRTRQGRKVA